MKTTRVTAVVLALWLETAYAASTVLLSAIPNPAVLDAPVSLTATVVPSSATGKVTFYNGVTVLGAAPVTAGVATLNPVRLPSGNLPLRAYYAGDSANPPATSAVLHETVNALPGNGFQPPIPTYAQASVIATGDFNGDGRIDLVAVDGYNSMTVLLGNGSGTFTQSYLYTQSLGASVFSSVTVGDLNGDGHADVVVSLLLGNAVIVFLGRGDGTFLGPYNYSTGGNPNSGVDFVALGDFNGDGIVDIVSAGHYSNSVIILLGNGDGTFKPASNYPAGNEPVGLALGDFNGDGVTDVATANALSSDITVMLGNGDGTFGAPAHFLVNAGVGPYSILAADFNQDGNTDLVEGGYLPGSQGASGVVLLLGHGDGTFLSNSPIYTGGPASVDVASGDFNGDGIPDLVAATGTDGSFAGPLSLLLGSGTGSFQITNFSTSGAIQQYLPVLAVADFNGDGIADVALAQGGAVVVYLGAAPVDVSITKSHTGVFQLGQTGAAFTISVSNLGPNATAGTVTVNDTPPSDFTVTAAGGTGWSCTLAVQCTRNDPLSAGVSYPPITVTVTVSTSAAPTVTNVATVSVAGDTNSSNNTSSDVVTVVHTQTINFGPIAPVTVGSTLTLTASATSGLPVSYMVSGNCTVSGNVVTATGIGSCTITASQAGSAGYTAAPNVVQTVAILSSTSSIVLLSSGSPSTFGSAVTLTATISPEGTTGRVTFYDGPTILGSQTVSSDTAALSVKLYSTGIRLLTAHYGGDGSHPPSTSASISQTVQSLPSLGFSVVQPAAPSLHPLGPNNAAVADFNGDGAPDIIAGAVNMITHNFTLAVYLNYGDGTFLPPLLSGTMDPENIVTGDFNADGKADIAVFNGSGIAVQFGNGDGTFGATASYPVILNSPLYAADLNGDGYPDLIGTFSPTNSAVVLLNKGDGTFYPATQYIVQGSGNELYLAIQDVNSDGKLDLVIGTVTNSGNLIAFLPGNGDGTFGAPLYTHAAPTGTSLAGLALGDLNGDGKLDAVVDEGSIVVLLGNGDGTFGAPSSFPSTNASAAGSAYQPMGQGVGGTVIVDVNGDGIPDVASTSTGFLEVYMGNGDGTLQPGLVYTYNNVPSGLALTDVNGDGRVDFVSALLQTAPIDILEGGPGPLLSLSMSHAGSIYQNETDLSYSLVVANGSGATATTGAVSVTDTVQVYGTIASMSGPGWACNVTATTCTRSDSLNAGASYPPITVLANVFDTSDATFTNSALVFGGGAPPTSARDTAPLVPVPPNCPISVNPGSFTFSSLAATASFSVVVPSGCSWTGTSGPPSWLSYTSQDYGTGDGTVTFAVTQNSSPNSRSMQLEIENQQGYVLIQVTQAGAAGLQFYPVTPCRLVDTRGTPAGFNGIAPFSGPSIVSGQTVTFPVQSAAEATANTTPAPCGTIPSTAQAYSLNVTVVPHVVSTDQFPGAVQYLSLGPSGSTQPIVSTLNDGQGEILANAAIVPAGTPSGGISVYNAGPSTADVILDLNGYFAATTTQGSVTGLQFFPVSPCRLVDTRGVSVGFNGISPFSGPSLLSGATANFPVQSSSEATADTTPAPCGTIPSGAQAYSLNSTLVPHAGVSDNFITLWPSGQAQPVVSTLNDGQGEVVANAAIVPAGTPSGGVSVFNQGPATADVILDLNGYFANPIIATTAGLKFYPVSPCRLVDTRGAGGGFNGISPFSGPSIAAGALITIPVQSAAEAAANTTPAPCGTIPSTAQAYSLNLTVVPKVVLTDTYPGAIDYVTIWPAGVAQPIVSTLNDQEALVVANAAIVPAGSGLGGISVYNAGPSAADVILDLNGYFAP